MAPPGSTGCRRSPADVKALLIQPRAMHWFWNWSPPPIGLLYMKAAAPEQTTVVDCAHLGIDERAVIDAERPDIVGCTAFTSTRHEVLAILEYAKAAGCTTVLGGPHVLTPATARQCADNYPFVDYIVRGDGEAAWRDLVNGLPRPRVSLDFEADIDALAPPDWSAVDVTSYLPRDSGLVHGVDLEQTPRISVVFSRGCPGRCRFCTTWHRPVRRHSPEWIERMLTPLADAGIRHLTVDDDCWGTDEENAIEISEVMGRLGFVWRATTRADLLTEDMVYAMADAGCYSITVGLEHGSPRMLELIGKDLDLQTVIDGRRYCWDAGVRFEVLCLQGYPGETEQDREIHDSFIRILDPDVISRSFATYLLPGSKIWHEAVKRGEVDDSVWLGPGRFCVSKPGKPVMWREMGIE